MPTNSSENDFDAVARSQVPLQVTDPQHQVGNRRRSRIDFDPVEVLRVHRSQFHLLESKIAQRVEHFAFQPLEVLQRDVQKVSTAARGVENVRLAQLDMKIANGLDGFGGLASPTSRPPLARRPIPHAMAPQSSA